MAAIIVEPLVQGAGGMRMHTPAELASLAAVARRHGVLWIADEVMTGGGRTGRLWAHQAAGEAPDLICAAKTLAGGVLPLAATLASPRVVAAWDTDDRRRTFFHGHSFTAHPLACAVAVANWKLLTASPPAVAARMEDFWNDALRPLRAAPSPRSARVREHRRRGIQRSRRLPGRRRPPLAQRLPGTRRPAAAAGLGALRHAALLHLRSDRWSRSPSAMIAASGS